MMGKVYQAECRECEWRSEFTESEDVATNQALGHEVGLDHVVRVLEMAR